MDTTQPSPVLSWAHVEAGSLLNEHRDESQKAIAVLH